MLYGFSTGLYKTAFSTYLYGKLAALSFCTFCVYVFCVESDVVYNICIIIVYIECVKCFGSHMLEAIYKKMITRHKNLITVLNRESTSREFKV